MTPPKYIIKVRRGEYYACEYTKMLDNTYRYVQLNHPAIYNLEDCKDWLSRYIRDSDFCDEKIVWSSV